jgi:putative transposase
MSFKLMESAQKRWRRLYGYKRLADVIEGVNFGCACTFRVKSP